jgi:hypothetical protein
VQILITRTLTHTRVACTVFVRGIGYVDGALICEHRQGHITLKLPWREFDIDSGETRMSQSGVYVTELISDKGLRFYVQSAAGDVWAAVQGMPRAIVRPEVEAIQQQAIA